MRLREKRNLFRIFIILTCIFIFIILYFLFLISLYIIPNNLEIPIIQLVGFAIVIIGIFYFFIDLNRGGASIKTQFKFKFLDENSVKIILMCFMIITFFIQPISFSESIIDWKQIGFFNYLRAIIFIIGCLFLPGANIFKIIFPKSTLHERFNIEPFFIKITMYPLISLMFLGTSTLILDYIGLKRELFTYILFLIIIVLFISDLVIQKLKWKNNLKLKSTTINISKNSFLILFIALGIIIIALGLHTSSKYLIPGDMYRGINYAYIIGRSDLTPSYDLFNYSVYWGYTSFSLSILSGIPYININAMLFPFLYLFITSIYLFMKAVLHDLNESYAILSTILLVIFSGLFYIFNSPSRRGTNQLILQGIFVFSFRSFAFFSLFILLALFIIIVKTFKRSGNKSIFKTEEFIIIILAALFLLQSYMIYFFPAIPAISLIIIYSLFSIRKTHLFKFFLIFFSFSIIFFIFFDIMSRFFYSWIPLGYLAVFLGAPLHIQVELVTTINFLNTLLIYSILIVSFLFFIFIYKIYNKFFLRSHKNCFKFKSAIIKIFKPKVLFILSLIIFYVLILLEINFIIFREVIPQYLYLIYNNFLLGDNFFTYYVDLIFLNIGFIGILGIFLSYFCFKENRRIFFILFMWGLFIFGLASLLIFKNWLQYPNIPPQAIPSNGYYNMRYWFTRIWVYSIIPISIVASIGLIRLKQDLKSKRLMKHSNKNLRITRNLTSTSIIIFLSLSNTIFSGMYWYNYEWYVNDDEAQVIGWISQNIPYNSNILIDSYQLRPLTDVAYYPGFPIYSLSEEIHNALRNFTELYYFGGNYEGWNISYIYDSNCSVEYLEELDGYESLLEFNDQNDNGNSNIDIYFNSSQQYGTIKYLIYSTSNSNRFWVNFTSRSIDGPHLWNGYFTYYNGTEYVKLYPYEENTWYQVTIDFEYTNGGYKGLNQYEWNLHINTTEYQNLKMFRNISQLGSIHFSTAMKDSNWEVFIENLYFSWAPEFNIEDIIFNVPIIIEYLKSKNLHYFVLFNHNIIQYQNFLTTLYRRKLYEYGRLAIYCTDDLQNFQF